MTTTRIQMTAALVSAALVLAVIFAVAPHTTVIANEVSGEIYGIDMFGTADTAATPEQKVAAH